MLLSEDLFDETCQGKAKGTQIKKQMTRQQVICLSGTTSNINVKLLSIGLNSIIY